VWSGLLIRRLAAPRITARNQRLEDTMQVTINGGTREVDVPVDMPLLWVLRDVLGMTGTKFGCGMALCGACTVQLGGRPIRSCITPMSAYIEAVETEDPKTAAALISQIVRYNEEDLDAMWAVYEWLRRLQAESIAPAS
jgi:succinate dehydrogenase/fumarate reductase-like Fe-S protein